MKTYKILILEDDLETVQKIVQTFSALESSRADFDLTVLSTYAAVEELINPRENDYDAILLDRDCKLGGSFHILDIERFGAHNIVSISSTPKWNEEAQARGVTRIVQKYYDDLDSFSHNLTNEIRDLLTLEAR